jgi:hypothetical protein
MLYQVHLVTAEIQFTTLVVIVTDATGRRYKYNYNIIAETSDRADRKISEKVGLLIRLLRNFGCIGLIINKLNGYMIKFVYAMSD